MRCVLIEDPEELRRHSVAWEDLVRAAAEPNVFYEPWFVFSALRNLPPQRRTLFLLVFDGEAQEGELCGLFPLEIRPFRPALPVPSLGLWKHLYCSLCTPLLRTGCERETVEAFFAWILEFKVGAPIADLQLLSGTGPFALALEEELRARNWPHISYSRYERAFLENPRDLEAYFNDSYSPKRRKRFRRITRRISEIGRFEELELEPGGNAGPWVEWFLSLEASGWKGRKGEALSATASHAAFFRDMAEAAFRRGVLMMRGLFLDGRPIAMLCDLRSGTGSFSFKTAFDEALSEYSPGVLVELFNLRNLQKYPEIRWMDSCASPRNWLINRLWTGRRRIQSVMFSGRRMPYGALISASAGLQRIRKRFGGDDRPRTEAGPEE